MRPRSLVLLFALAAAPVAAAGCRVEALEGAAYQGPKNRCELGCGAAACVDGACRAGETSYELLLEVTPPSNASYGRDVTFTVPITDRIGGKRNLQLPDTARVFAKLDVGKSIPLALRLTREPSLPGTAATAYEARPLPRENNNTVELTVPPGSYSLYVTPVDDADLESFPPVQLRNESNDKKEPLILDFESGAHELTVSYTNVRTFDLTLTDDKGKPLTDPKEARDISVIDAVTGRLVSTVQHTCTKFGDPLLSEVVLKRAPELAGHSYLLRVAPAKVTCSSTTAPIRPTYDFDLAALDIEGRGKATVALTQPGGPILVTGSVRAFGTGESIVADVIFRSRSVKTSSGVKVGPAWVVATARSDAGSGSFNMIVPSGSYTAEIVPDATNTRSRLYAICADCPVDSTAPDAKPGEKVLVFDVGSVSVTTAFEIARRVQVTGRAVGFDGELFGLGTFDASSAHETTLFTGAGSPLLARSQTTSITKYQDKAGTKFWNLSAGLDPGLYDVILKIPELSGYPWIVRPRVEVKPSKDFDLGDMKATAPVLFSGEVVDPRGVAIPRASIRARAVIVDSVGRKIGAVVVGETKADEDGNYHLLVPSALDVPPPTTKPPT